MTGQDWACEAYGEDMPGPRHCFFELGDRCATAAECSERLTVERQRLHRRIQDMAADSDPDSVWAQLAEDFPTPEGLLGGPDAPDADEESR